MPAVGKSAVVVEPGTGTVEIFPLSTDEETLVSLLHDCFDEWEHIHFGPLIQGAAWEIRAPVQPRITMLDGYATVHFGDWHFHICIGEHREAEPEVARIRRTARAELYRTLLDGTPTSWGVRLFNGAGEQQITVLLPSPFLSDRQDILDQPDFDRLYLWDRLRTKYLGLEPDETDRTGTGFRHG